ncbi:MurR/RpiR family transcriptional regulator [Ectobacillus sp. JY-23]|uniref:MurR/RpiR family transcriptional regulator n=1 Tax=Ectobacillus sp. JY-23 TaxID=2933872 RepID=UPI001FF4A20F|nr:MurR/RpiR family transcriptional regulator [Ectobacillus sp. JY-23]UOY91778.1 MurR/RpiR family transcriptional regulator [Ectobacillus sp. JY-23]
MEQPQHCLTRIQSFYPEFSETEKKVADYILQYPEKMMHQPINQVAEDIGVATSTVFRFCQRLGFKGYQTMKIVLAAELATPLQERVQERIQEYDNERAVTEKIFNTSIRTFKDTIQMMDFSLVKKAVNIILKAERVEFYGIGNSGIVAQDAHHKFIGSGVATVAYTDMYLQLRAATQLTEQDAVVIIADSGSHTEMLQVLEAAKEAGAKTIVITNLTKSPVNKKADIVLRTVTTGIETRSEDIFSRIVQLSLIDALYTSVMKSKKETGKGTIQKLKRIFE